MTRRSGSGLKLIFIAGASRSGSTMLAEQIAAATGGVNCGELRRIRDFYVEDWNHVAEPANRVGCSCGQSLKECDFWTGVADRSGLDLARTSFSGQVSWAQGALFKVSALLLGARGTRLLARVWEPFRREVAAAENCFALYEAAAEIAQTDCVIDASKWIHQYLMLRTARPEAVKLITLVRDGRAVRRSMLKGARRAMREKHLGASGEDVTGTDLRLRTEAANAWFRSTANALIAHLLVRPSRRILVRYEDFCQHPHDSLDRIRDHFALSTGTTEGHAASHAIGGSPSRFSKEFRAVRLDEAWRSHWTPAESRSFGWWAHMMNNLLGYD